MQHYSIKDEGDLEQALSQQKDLPNVYLGEILVDAGLITESQLCEALENQKQRKDKHLGRILIDLGMVTSDQVNTALARKFGIPFVKLEDFNITAKALALVPSDLALKYNIIPLGEIQGSLVVAMENPLDASGIEFLRFNTNLNIETVMASAQDISLALSRYYSKFDEDEALEDSQIDLPESSVSDISDSLHQAEAQAKKKPIVRLLNAVVLQGVIRGASDISIRPERDRVNVFYRVDGKFQHSRTLHRSLLNPLVSRVKIIGQMDISERRIAQDGHARISKGKKSIDLRISVIPTVDGESVAIRILDKDVGLKPLNQLGFSADVLTSLKEILGRSHGMILVTGPTGSGKSTTMYALLNEIKKRDPHLLTVEDPVEYDLEGAEQVQIAPAKGFGFATVLKHFLRHDPDVIMVGEIRDFETAEISNKAALTGHLVLSTLHTNDAASTVTRLTDMGIEPYIVSSTLLGVVAQRLIRVICKDCKTKQDIDPNIKKSLGLSMTQDFYHGAGCPACNYNGYKGRALVTEFLKITPEIVQLINASANTQDIFKVARSQGMSTITDNAIKLAMEGKTSVDEVVAVRLD